VVHSWIHRAWVLNQKALIRVLDDLYRDITQKDLNVELEVHHVCLLELEIDYFFLLES
jgi:hypothetical protein